MTMQRRYHLHLPALLYCFLVLLVGSAAMNSQNNMLFWIFGLMFSGLIISGIVSGVMMLGIQIRRIDPEHVAVGEPLIVRYQIRNRNRFVPIFNIHIEELPVGSFGHGGGAKAATEHVSERGWQRLMDRGGAWVMHVGPRETVHGEAIFWPIARGEATFGAIRVWTTFPFGLIKKSITIEQPQHTRIYPRLYQLRRGLLRSIDTPGPVGTRITQRAGGADDYFGLREYRHNESIRHIAWKRSATWGGEQIVCIERSLPSPPRIRVVIDLSTPTDELRVEAHESTTPRELEERAISLAASVIHQANQLGYEIGLTVVGVGGANPIHLPVRRNFWHARRLLAALASINLDENRDQPDFAILFDQARAGLLVIRPDRVRPLSDRSDITYFTARQLDRLTAGPIGWKPQALDPPKRADRAWFQPLKFLRTEPAPANAASINGGGA